MSALFLPSSSADTSADTSVSIPTEQIRVASQQSLPVMGTPWPWTPHRRFLMLDSLALASMKTRPVFTPLGHSLSLGSWCSSAHAQNLSESQFNDISLCLCHSVSILFKAKARGQLQKGYTCSSSFLSIPPFSLFNPLLLYKPSKTNSVSSSQSLNKSINAYKQISLVGCRFVLGMEVGSVSVAIF